MINQKNIKSIGIDVSKSHLDICLYPDNIFHSIKNNEESIKWLMQFIDKHKDITTIALEPSGGYEKLVLETLLKHSYPASLVNALHIRRFAQSSGDTAKTDKIDSLIIAKYCYTFELATTMALSEEQKELKALVDRRENVVNMIVAEKNRLEKKPHPKMKEYIEQNLKFLEQQLKQLDKDILDILNNTNLKQIYDILVAIKGVGVQTAAIIIADIPEAGTLSGKKISKLVGVCPINHDSGKMRGQRHIRGGRMRVRNALYMAALSAIKYNEEIKNFYQKLRSVGKDFKVAIVATMRKMINIINGKITNLLAGNEVF